MYKQITPATDWFYIEHHKEQDSMGMYYVAAWGLCETSGNVYGLISVTGSGRYDDDKSARLVRVPPNETGMYKHKNELNSIEQQALKNDGFLKGLSKLQEKETV